MAAREDAGTSRTLVVFDFDWSLVEDNSDTWVLDQLGATDIFKRLKATGMRPAQDLYLHVPSTVCTGVVVSMSDSILFSRQKCA